MESEDERGSGHNRGVDVEMEQALNTVGGNTWWMWRIFLATSVPGIFSVCLNMSWVFVAADVNFRCRVAALDAASFTDEQQRNITDTARGTKSCQIPDLNYSYLANLPYEKASAIAAAARETAVSTKCEKFVFEEKGTSLVEEYSLVCDRLHMLSDIQMVVACGKLTGSFIFGAAADKWGRKPCFIIASSIFIVFNTASAFVPWYWSLTLMRFVLGMMNSGYYAAGSTLFLEVVKTKLRGMLSIAFNVPYGLGMLLLALMAYHVRQWRQLQLHIALPSVLLIVSCWVIPESPRWLVSQGRLKDAWAVIEKADKKLAHGKETIKNKDVPRKYTCRKACVDLFKSLGMIVTSAELRWRTLICLCNWIFTSMIYYTLSLNSGNFSTDRYIYVAMLGLIECICYVSPVPFVRFIGRRPMSAFMYIVTGTMLLLILVIPEDYHGAVLAAALTGRLFNGSVFAVIILHTNELFPTEKRTTAVGITSAMSHIGGMMAPYIVVHLGAIDKTLPSLLCGTISFLTAFLVLFLPETKGKELFNTVREMEDATNENKMSRFRRCFGAAGGSFRFR